MTAIPLGKSTYDRTDLPPLILRNMLFERAPTVEGEVSIVGRPSLKQFALVDEEGDPGVGPIRGLFRKGGVLPSPYSGAIVALCGTALYRVTQAGQPGVGTAVEIGTGIAGSYRMSAEGDGNAVMFTCGSTLYTTNGASVSTVTFPSSFTVSAVDYLNSYFLAATELGRFYWSAIGGTTFDALDYATAESAPDILISLKVVGDELWLFGRLTVEVWRPTGDLDLPFQRIDGRVTGIGVTARDTVQKANVGGIDVVCWLGTDRRVYMTQQGRPVDISDAALEQVLQDIEVDNTASTSNPYAVMDSWNGHDVYSLTIPGRGTWSYDMATGTWHERASHEREVFRANVWTVGPNSQPLLGDDETNTIWEMSVDQDTDGEDPILFEASALVETSQPVRADNLILEIAAGTALSLEDDPVIQMQWSDNLGKTWTEPKPAYLGRQGEWNARVMWSRMGLIRRPGRIYRWSTTKRATIRKAWLNEGYR